MCAINETQKTLEVHKIEGFSKYHNFTFEVEGIRARGVITEPQGSTDLIVHENFFPLKEARVYKRVSGN